ncbi:RNA polymerase sigma-70 factor [Pedobacter gandavensis]|uniref:RNA polymerase sigma factor n=1 Tax=Pedobacter gandavensis TaxID=2679963 RepID=UPI00292FD15E|nr:RNA polymerase sigma-70 factor [Pedobacter gandavensis]
MILYPSLSDLQLVNLLKEDDQAAFTEIYRRYAEKLTGFASSKLYSLEDSRDVIHDVFVKLWEERQSLNIDRNLEGYLFTLIRYRIVDKIRKNITREDYAGMVMSLKVSQESEVEKQIAVKEIKQSVEYALQKLSPRVREIYHLSREENLTISEIAARLQLSEQTVKNQLTFALKHLRQSLTYLSVYALFIWCQ